MNKFIYVFVFWFCCFVCAGQANAGAAAGRRNAQQQQMMQKQMIMQRQAQEIAKRKAQIVARQQMQAVAQQAAQAQAQAIAQQQVQAVVIKKQVQAIAKQQAQAVAQTVAHTQASIQRQVQAVTQQAVQHGLASTEITIDVPVGAVATLDDVVFALSDSSRDWNLIIDMDAKAAVVAKYIATYRAQGVVIKGSSMEYAQIIDGMSKDSPDMLGNPFPQILKIVAIMQYDFDNGESPDALAFKILGTKEAVMKNKSRLGF